MSGEERWAGRGGGQERRSSARGGVSLDHAAKACGEGRRGEVPSTADPPKPCGLGYGSYTAISVLGMTSGLVVCPVDSSPRGGGGPVTKRTAFLPPPEH